MAFFIFLMSIMFGTFSANLYADESNPLYQLPEKLNLNNVQNSNVLSEKESDLILVASDKGLFKVTENNLVMPLWTEARVDQIVSLDNNSTKGWYLRTAEGILFTNDLINFEKRNTGLPFLTIKNYDGENTTLKNQIQELKDLCVNPCNPLELVTATKDNVYISEDGGLNWKNIGSMSRTTSGMKAVAIATIESEMVVFMSHPIFGLSYILPNSEKPVWIDVEAGFKKMESMTSPDEISDILPVLFQTEDGNTSVEIYISQMYLSTIYSFNWEKKLPELIYKGEEPLNTIDGLSIIDNVILYTKLEGFGAIDLNNLGCPGKPANEHKWRKSFSAVPGMINSAWLGNNRSGFSKSVVLSELWMLYPGTINSPYAEKANDVKAIYASSYQCRNQNGIDKFKKVIKDRNMNAVVIDMKDDYGFLRYDTQDPLLMEKGHVTKYKIDLDHFIKEFKEENIYLIARIVTFKDKMLASYDGGKYAVWDKKYNKQWLGIRGYEDITDEEGNVTKETTYYDEVWVDPYCEEVWEYNVRVAQELISRGFDEIQFDYIRFPTDGINLSNAKYRWQNSKMDKESALISFLSYARENIDAPIGIDIYGANGWYRSGARTGQDSEMLSEYVDVIGPMFYPSHFEQSFLDYAPFADRTYRIYYYGSLRNTIMCRNRAIVRPWIQSFYMNCSYDRLYYDSDYIKKEFFGVRDSIDRGYMCWNNSGEYGVTPPDLEPNEPFIGTAYEANEKFEKPTIGTARKPIFTEENVEAELSILDSILIQYKDDYSMEYGKKSYLPFLQIAVPSKHE